jgi:nucleotide-binding universal stress UspA family protein
MIKDIFVPLLDGSADGAALDAAMALARAFGAHVQALVTLEHPMPLVTEIGYLPTDLTELQLEQARSRAAAQAARARARLAREDVASDVRTTELMALWSEAAAAWSARHADLSVLGRDDASAGSRFQLAFGSLLLRSGRPLLVVPAAAALVAPVTHAVAGWKPTPGASRALHDALPLLAPGARLDVVVVDPKVSDGAHGEEPGADIARHLVRHGLDVRVVRVPSAGLAAGDVLLEYVRSVDAGLLVMGGYGHARWREVLLGGATRLVASHTRTPVLFSH